MRRSERAGVALISSRSSRLAQSCGSWKSLTSIVLITAFFIIHPAESNPINRQVGISENVFITVQNDTYGNEQRVCSIDSVTYTDGESIPTASPCEHCICRPPGFACTIISCEYRPGCKALKRSNQCCPEYQCECEKDGKIYQNGEKILDNNNPCEVCYCQGGDVICAVIDCYWRSDCQPRYIENRCCPLYDHCPPPNLPGPMRPTQRPLTTSPASTTTTGTTVGWFNLSSSIFASSSTPFAIEEDLSSTTAVSVSTTTTPAAVPVVPESQANENEDVAAPAAQQLPAEKEQEEEEKLVSHDQSTPVVPVVVVEPINIIPASSSPSTSESPIAIASSTEGVSVEEPVKDVLLSQGTSSSSESPAPIVTSEVPVQPSSSAAAVSESSSVNPIQSQETSTELFVQPEVSLPSSSSSSPVPVQNLVTDSPPAQEDSVQIIDDDHLSSSSVVVAPSPSAEVEIPSTTVISNVVPVIIVATPVQDIHTVQEETTRVPDLSVVVSDVEQLPVSVQPSSSVGLETSVLVTVDPTEAVLETITVVNTLDTVPSSSSSVAIEPAPSSSVQVINPTASSTSLPQASAVVPSSNLVVDAADAVAVPENEIVSEQPSVVDRQPEIQIQEAASSVAPPVQVVEVEEAAAVSSEKEPQTTTPLPSLPIAPSVELLPPSPSSDSVVQDDKQQQQQAVDIAPPSIELQPPAEPAHDPISPEIVAPPPSSSQAPIENSPMVIVISTNPEPVDEPIKSTDSPLPEAQTISSSIEVGPPSSQKLPESSSLSSSSAEVVEQTTVVVSNDDVPEVVKDSPPPQPEINVQPSVSVNYDEGKTTNSPVSLNDPVVGVTEIPTERPDDLADDLSSVSSSSEISSSSSSLSPVIPVETQTEATVVQDVPAADSSSEGATTVPSVITSSGDAQIVQDDSSQSSSSSSSSGVVVEVTDSAPIFVETSDIVLNNVTQDQSDDNANIPTAPSSASVVVSDDVTTEVVVDFVHSSTVPAESLVSVSFSDVNDANNAVTATGDQLDSQDQSDPTSVSGSSSSSDDENSLQDNIVVTTTQKLVADEQPQNDEVVVEVTTVVSSSSSSSSSSPIIVNDSPSDVVPESSSTINKNEAVESSQPTENIVNDEPSQTTVLSVQADDQQIVLDEGVNGGQEKIEVTTILVSIPEKEEKVVVVDAVAAASVGATEVLSDEPATSAPVEQSVVADEGVSKVQAQPEVESNVRPEAASSSINEEPVETTTTLASNVVASEGEGVQFDESPSSQNEETTVRSSSILDSGLVDGGVQQNDEPQAVTSLPVVVPAAESLKKDAVKPAVELNEISVDSSESKFRLDPSVFNEIESTSIKQEVVSTDAGHVHASNDGPSSIADSNNDETTTSFSSQADSFDDQQVVELKSSESNHNIVVSNDAEQGVTTEINRKAAQDLHDGEEQQDAIELTTVRSTLGDERKDLELLEGEKSTSQINKDTLIPNPSKLVGKEEEDELKSKPTEVTSSQDEKVDENDEPIFVTTTAAALLLRHHHAGHEGFDEETTKLPQQQQNDETVVVNSEDSPSSNVQNTQQEIIQATTTTVLDAEQDEPAVATTTTISSKHDFRSGLDSAELNVVSVSSSNEELNKISNVVPSSSSSANDKLIKEVQPVQSLTEQDVNDEPVVATTGFVPVEIFDLPETTNVPPSPLASLLKTLHNNVKHDDDTVAVEKEEDSLATTVVADSNSQNDDVIINTTTAAASSSSNDSVISQNESESIVNDTDNIKSSHFLPLTADHPGVVIPSELVKRLDPITDDLGQNGLGRSDLSLQSQMKDEVSSADDTWFWRAVNRVRTLPDFLPTLLSRQPRSTHVESAPSTKPELFKPNKTKKATQAMPERKKHVPHRPFLFW